MLRIVALATAILAVNSTLAASARAEATVSISCSSLGIEQQLCQSGSEAWAKATGNKVKLVATPADANERLALYQTLLAAQAKDIDVFQIDVIWPAILAPHLVDLGSVLSEQDRADHFKVLTDNKNRTVGEMRHLMGKYGGNLAAENSVAWMFDRKGYIVVEKSKADEDTLMSAALEAGADDLRDDGDSWEVLSSPEAFQKVLDAVKGLGIEPGAAELAMLPQNYVKLEGRTAQQVVRLMEALEEHDDTRHVWSNFDIEEKEIEASLA